MINQVIGGVVAALDAAFGDGYPIHTDNVEQGLKAPCFSVACVSPSEKQVLGPRYFRRHLICVYYFPTPKGGNRERNAVIGTLFSRLEYITCGTDVLRGTDMAAHTEDGVVVFNVNYDFFVRKPNGEPDIMNELKVRASANEQTG